MKAYTYLAKGKFAFTEKPKPRVLGDRDAVVRVTLASICTSDLHIRHGSVPRAVPGIAARGETASPSTWKRSAASAFSAAGDM